jgi:hypothetical protein
VPGDPSGTTRVRPPAWAYSRSNQPRGIAPPKRLSREVAAQSSSGSCAVIAPSLPTRMEMDRGLAQVCSASSELVKTEIELAFSDHQRRCYPDSRAVRVLSEHVPAGQPSQTSRPVPSRGSPSTPAHRPRERKRDNTRDRSCDLAAAVAVRPGWPHAADIHRLQPVARRPGRGARQRLPPNVLPMLPVATLLTHHDQQRLRRPGTIAATEAPFPQHDISADILMLAGEGTAGPAESLTGSRPR